MKVMNLLSDCIAKFFNEPNRSTLLYENNN